MNVEKIIQDWLKELDFKEPIMIRKNYNLHNITIITLHQRSLIGRMGKDVNHLKELFKNKWDIKFFEASEIIYPPNAIIDTRDFDEIWEERSNARFKMWKV